MQGIRKPTQVSLKRKIYHISPYELDLAMKIIQINNCLFKYKMFDRASVTTDPLKRTQK